MIDRNLTTNGKWLEKDSVQFRSYQMVSNLFILTYEVGYNMRDAQSKYL